MNKLIATALVGMGVLSAGTAYAADGTITINGEVTATSCDVSINGAAGSDASLTLDTVSSVLLTTNGDVAGAKDLGFKLTNCATGGSVRAFFEQDNVDSTTGNLNNTDVAASGGAQNVQVQILNNAGTAINLNTQNANNFVNIINKTADVNYMAQYIATAQSVAGTVATQLVYTLEYQ